MPLSKRLLIIFLAFWLPISVVAAGSMSLAMAGPASQEASAEGGAGCPQHADHDEESNGPGSDDCHGCSFCQFACTAMMSIATPAAGVRADRLAVEFVPTGFQLSVLELLQRPPLFHPA